MQDDFRIFGNGKSSKTTKKHQHHKFPSGLGSPKPEGKDEGESYILFFGHYHNNKRMIAEWRQQKYKTPEEYYIDSRLTDAVYEDSTFAAKIKDIVRESIKNAKGRIETLVIKKKILVVFDDPPSP